MTTATVTSKGQITIPKEIREFLHLDSGDRINFLMNDEGQVSIVPATCNITSLKGIIPKPKKPVTLAAMKKTIRKRGSRS